MSNLYGNQMIPSDVSSLYFYDKTYTVGEDLAKRAEDDGVFIGRYILVKGNGENQKSHSKAYRKVVGANGSLVYEEVAVLDGATPSITIGSTGYGKEYFNTATVFSEASTDENSISISDDGGYDDNGTYAMSLNINLPALGESVGQMYNVLYGSNSATRATNVNSAATNFNKISVGGNSIADNGLIGMLAKIDWTTLGSAAQTQWANTYLGLNDTPGTRRLDGEYLKLSGGTMTGGISLTLPEDGSSLSFGVFACSANDISITKTLQTKSITTSPTFTGEDDDQIVPNYGMVKRLVNTNGKAYVLTSGDYSGTTSITLTNSEYKNLPEGTIFFIPVGS